MPPICISVINMKGGVGKTTVTALLARDAARRIQPLWNGGFEVLAIDLDPQANLSQALMSDSNDYQEFLDSRSPSIVEVFSGYRPPAPGQSSATSLDVNDALHNVYGYTPYGSRISYYNPFRRSGTLQLIPSRFDFADNLVSAVRPDPRRLAEVIANNFQDKDFIFIDCAPTESIFTQAAYHASRYVLVPVRPEFLATIGFPLLQDSLDSFRRNNRGHQIDVLGVVINNWTYTSGNSGGPETLRGVNEIIEEAHKNEWYVFENKLGYSRGFPKMMRGDYSYLGDAQKIFRRFADEFLGRLATLRP